MSSHDEFEFEAVPGLPAALPAGEHVIWRGSPNRAALARHVFHVRKMAFYFAVLLCASVAQSVASGQSLLAALVASRGPFAFACLALGILLVLATLSARATIYTLTSRRLVIRHGIALPMSLNIPLAVMDAAAIRNYSGSTGEIAVRLSRGQRIGYLLTWPHVRRWHLLQPQPSIRAIDDVAHVAELLSKALAGNAAANATAEPRAAASSHETLRPAQPVAA